MIFVCPAVTSVTTEAIMYMVPAESVKKWEDVLSFPSLENFF